jgi:hypothetical protein
MKKNISIQLKAAVLLLVFGLNTIVGFACGIGIDMGFNSTHHHDEEATEIHVHADGKTDDHHNPSAKHQHEEKKTDSNEKKGCCNDEVQKLQRLDKALNQNAKTAIDAPVFVAIISTFLGIDIFNSAKAYPPKYVARFFYPPPPDIRIAIQSFQI